MFYNRLFDVNGKTNGLFRMAIHPPHSVVKGDGSCLVSREKEDATWGYGLARLDLGLNANSIPRFLLYLRWRVVKHMLNQENLFLIVLLFFGLQPLPNQPF